MPRYAVGVDVRVEAADPEDAVIRVADALRTMASKGTLPAGVVLHEVRGGGDLDEVREVGA